MKTHLLQTSFRVRSPRATYQHLCERLTPGSGIVPGLISNAWIFNEARSECGGIYLFESREALRAFVDGPIVTDFRSNPALENVTLRTLDVLENPGVATPFGASRDN